MSWVILALLAALATATRDAAAKRATARLDPVSVALGIAAVPAIALGSLVIARGVGEIRPGFSTALLVSGGINAVATPLIVWALERSDLSLVSPLTSLTPLFMIATGALVLGEYPTLIGGTGVAVIVAGAYLLNASDRHVSALEPFRALLRDPGARAMLLVAVLYSISATFDKVGVQASSPLLWAAAIQAFVVAALGPLVMWRGIENRRPGAEGAGMAVPFGRGKAVASWRPVALAGAVISVGMVAQNAALTLTLAAYVIAVKRTSTLFGVFLGRSLFGEERTGERLFGAAVMLVGFLLVTLG